MSDQLEKELEDEVIVDEAEGETDAEVEDAELESEQEEGEESEGDIEVDKPDEPEELTIEIEGVEEDQEDDNTVIRSLRDELKKARSEAKELRKQVPAKEAKLGPKPTLADHDYDEAAHEKALLNWYQEKQEVEAAEKEAQAEIERQQEEYSQKHSAYVAEKAKLGVKDIDDVEAVVADTLPKELQSTIVATSKHPALTVLALGRNPKIMGDMAKLDPVQFAYKLAELERKMKTPTKTKPAPEKRLEAPASVPKSPEKQLDRLREEAQKTGDYSKVRAFKAKLRSQ